MVDCKAMKFCVLIFSLAVFPATSFAQASNQRADVVPFPASGVAGKWVRYSFKYTEVRRINKHKTEKLSSERLCNVCPEIDFRADSSVTVKLQGSDVLPVHVCFWVIGGNAILIRDLADGESKSAPFPAGKYTVEARKAGNLKLMTEVVLIDSKGVRHILTKSGQ